MPTAEEFEPQLLHEQVNFKTPYFLPDLLSPV